MRVYSIAVSLELLPDRIDLVWFGSLGALGVALVLGGGALYAKYGMLVGAGGSAGDAGGKTPRGPARHPGARRAERPSVGGAGVAGARLTR
jgi:hypothetical protein